MNSDTTSETGLISGKSSSDDLYVSQLPIVQNGKPVDNVLSGNNPTKKSGFISSANKLYTTAKNKANEFKNKAIDFKNQTAEYVSGINIPTEAVKALKDKTGIDVDVGRKGTLVRLVDSASAFLRSTGFPYAIALISSPIGVSTLGAAGITATTLTGGTAGLAILIVIMITVQIAKRTKGEKALQDLLRLVQVVCVELYITNAIINELSMYFNVPLNERIKAEIKSRIDSLMEYVFKLFHIKPDPPKDEKKSWSSIDLDISGKIKYVYRWVNQTRINSEIVNGLTVINSLYSQLFSQLYFELMEKEHLCTDPNNKDPKCKFISMEYKEKPKTEPEKDTGSEKGSTKSLSTNSSTSSLSTSSTSLLSEISDPEQEQVSKSTPKNLFMFNSTDKLFMLEEDEIDNTNGNPISNESQLNLSENATISTSNDKAKQLKMSIDFAVAFNEKFTQVGAPTILYTYKDAYLYWTKNSNLYELLKSKEEVQTELFNIMINNLSTQTDLIKEVNDSIYVVTHGLKRTDAVGKLAIDKRDDKDKKTEHGVTHYQGGYYRKKIATQLNNVFKKNEMLIRKMAKRVKPKRTRNKRKYRKLTRRR